MTSVQTDSPGLGEPQQGQKYVPCARDGYVCRLPENPEGRILDIGCANGTTGELALRENRCGYYCGVEICEKSAEAASLLLGRRYGHLFWRQIELEARCRVAG